MEALEHQVHNAMGINVARRVHRCIANRADASAGDQNHPVVVFVTAAMFGRDVHYIFAVEMMGGCGRGLTRCSGCAYWGRSQYRGGKKPQIPCGTHLGSPPFAEH
jgi:hypothetical protein